MVLLWKFVIQLIFVANSPPHPDGQELDHPARGRNCPLEISSSAQVEDTGRGKERDEWLRKKRSEREGGRATKMTGWGEEKKGGGQMQPWPNTTLALGHGIGFALLCISMCFLRSLWEERMHSHTGCICGLTQATD